MAPYVMVAACAFRVIHFGVRLQNVGLSSAPPPPKELVLSRRGNGLAYYRHVETSLILKAILMWNEDFRRVKSVGRHVSNTKLEEQRINVSCSYLCFKFLKPSGYLCTNKFNIQRLYILPVYYLCALYLSRNTRRRLSYMT